ncbi:hypothetical protein BMS3Bbin11_00970 [bacterium BMS3Bbin11]|nr:hypothetical protein BMS3Bbin11_00970 [bacterium BMS3Bbin11]
MWCSNIFKIDTTKTTCNASNGIDKVIRVFCIDFYIKHIDVGKTFKQHGLALHDGFASQWASIAKTKHSRAIGDHGYQVTLTGVAIGIFRVIPDFQHRYSDSWSISQGKVFRCGSGLGNLNCQFPRSG